jgi:hypothetical protein
MSKKLLCTFAGAFLASPLLASPLLAQDPSPSAMWNTVGANDYANLGAKLVGVGDLDGDSKTDFLSLAPNADVSIFSNAGRVTALSAVDGSLIWESVGWQDSQNFGALVSCPGDLNGDGIDDFVVAEPGASGNNLINCGRVTGVSGTNGVILWQKYGASNNAELGRSVIAAGDSNGDGLGDLLLSQPMASTGTLTRNGMIELISGNANISIWTAEGTRDGEMLGAGTKVVDDVDGDGLSDVITGSPEASTSGHYFNGVVTMLSSVDGSQLWQLEGGDSLARLGEAITFGGDVDGDSLGDVVLRSPSASTNGLYDNGAFTVVSGGPGTVIWSVDGPSHGSSYGSSYKFVNDINGDGVPDVLIGIPGESKFGMAENGAIRALSGLDGLMQWEVFGFTPFGRLGSSFLILGDVNGDGYDEFSTGLDTAGTQGRIDNGYLQTHSTKTGMMLWRFDGTTSGEQLGKVTLLVEDISGDGISDIVVSSHLADVAGFGDNGKITAIASSYGYQLWSAHGDSNRELLGRDMRAASDIDGDGIKDLYAFSPRADTHGLRDNGMVKVISTNDGSTIWRYDGGHDGDRVGEARVISYDHDYDGANDIILGSALATTGGMLSNGAVVAISSGRALRLAVDRFRSGGWATLSLHGMLPGTRAHFFGTLYGPGNTVMVPGLTLALYPPVIFLGGNNADATGHAQINKRVPVGFTGMVAWLQGVQDNLGTYSTSNMQQSTFQ